MDTPTEDPRAMGVITKMLSRVLGHMPAEDRTALMQDAATMTTSELGKASDQLAAAKGPNNMMAVDSAHTGWIDDHWSETRTTEVPPVSSAHGPGSSAPSGDFLVGPSQQAAGNGGVKMEREYSRFAPQHGIQNYADQLGRDLIAAKSVMRSLVAAVQGISTQIDVIKATMVSPAPLPDEAVMIRLIDTAVGKAVTEAVAKAVSRISIAAKAKDDKDEKGDDEEAKSASLLAKADEKKKKDEEDEDDKPFGKAEAAAELRVEAKARVDHARLRIAKALDYVAEGKPKAAQRAMALAEINLAKAQELVDDVVSLCDGHAGLNTQVVRQSIAKAKKGIAASVADNQDIWPASTETEMGKASETATGEAAKPPANADLAKAMEQIQAAASGMGMLQASVSDMMQALTAKNTAVIDGEQTKLPPVFALAKAGASDLTSREIELARLRDTNVISFDAFDQARDALMRVRMNMPPDVIAAMVDRLPDAAKAVLTRGAA